MPRAVLKEEHKAMNKTDGFHPSCSLQSLLPILTRMLVGEMVTKQRPQSWPMPCF